MTNEEIYLYKKAQNGGGSSVINEINGVFIDTDNVIDSGSYNPSNPLNYTATEDCVALITLISQSNHCYVYVDSINIYHLYTDNTTSMNLFVPLKKGQVLTASTAFSAESSGYAIYGIQQGSQDTTKNEIYSTDERAVGTWIDGSTIYQKTLYKEYAFRGTNHFDMVNLKSIISVNGFGKNVGAGNSQYILPHPNESDAKWSANFQNITSTGFDLVLGNNYSTTTSGSYLADIYVTVQYTKSTT